MINILTSPAFGISLSIAAYGIGVYIRNKTRLSLANPLAIATILIILVIQLTPLTLDMYLSGTSAVTLFLIPVTTILAIKIHSQWALLRANIIPILVGCITGCIVSMTSVYFLCRLFKLGDILTASLLPKSVTSAIAMELSADTGGIGSLTVSVVVFTGIVCAVLTPLLVRIFRLKNPVALGMAMGTSGHAMGTAKAIELGEVEGAVSGIALTLSGVITSLLYLIVF